jgi:FKBP-type peptidyl-prolyl cis-trans isomerase
MKKLSFNNFSALILIILSLPGCLKDNTQEFKDREMELLQQYIEDNDITQEPTASGLYYISTDPGTGIPVVMDDYVDLEFTTELVTGVVLYTSDPAVAKENDLYNENVVYGPWRTRVGYTGIPGLDEGMQYMNIGGKATLIMPSDINGYGGIYTARSPSYSTHIWTIEIVNAFDDPVSFEAEQISAYLDSNDIDLPLTTESGLYYVVHQEGEGDFISDVPDATMWYKGMFIDGRVFESNLDASAVNIHTNTDPILVHTEAWEELTTLLQQGTKATVIIPYELAFGEGHAIYMPLPYMTLVYEIEIVAAVTVE